MKPLEPTPNKRLYPKIHAEIPKNPKKLYALPIIGYFVKNIVLIPANIILVFYGLIGFVAYVINSFVILFTGKYWNFAYKINISTLEYFTRIHFFLYGITDTYPGFSVHKKIPITIEIPKPENPNRLYAIPIIGFLIRLILLIPFFIYIHIIVIATAPALIGAIIFVFFKGFYPESCFEIIKDSQRLTLALSSYIFGLSDTYPSFKISLNHKGIKIFFIIMGIILFLLSSMGKNNTKNGNLQNYHKIYPLIKH